MHTTCWHHTLELLASSEEPNTAGYGGTYGATAEHDGTYLMIVCTWWSDSSRSFSSPNWHLKILATMIRRHGVVENKIGPDHGGTGNAIVSHNRRSPACGTGKTRLDMSILLKSREWIA